MRRVKKVNTRLIMGSLKTKTKWKKGNEQKCFQDLLKRKRERTMARILYVLRALEQKIIQIKCKHARDGGEAGWNTLELIMNTISVG